MAEQQNPVMDDNAASICCWPSLLADRGGERLNPLSAAGSALQSLYINAFLPALRGFGLLSITFFTRSIVFSTLLSALGYGVTWKLLMMAAAT